MKNRRILASMYLLPFALLAAACGSADPGAVDGDLLHYSYQPGDSLAYDLDASLSVVMSASGNPMVAGAMDADMVMAVTARLGLDFAAGPSPDTIEITVTQELLDGGARMETMGQEMLIPLDDLAAQMEQEVVLVVDSQGRPVSATVGGMALPAQLLAGTSSFGSGNLLTPQQFGPEFPDKLLAVGSEWTTDQTTEVLGLTFRQTGRHRIVAAEELAGRAVLRITSELTTAAIRTDLASLIAALQASPELLGGMDPGEMEAALAQLQGTGATVGIVMERSTASMTTWFDPAEGIVIRAVLETPMNMTMTMRGLPGGEVSVLMRTSTSQRLDLAA